jgi:ABC-type amino acid transport substrate-binding protein
MRRIIFSHVGLVVLMVLMIVSCSKEEGKWKNTHLRFISEEYNPFNYTENSKAAGLAPELLKQLCSQLDMDCEIEFLPWAEGYNAALTTDNTVLFSTTLNSVRKDKFKWVGPFATIDWNFYASNRTINQLNSLSDAKNVGKIGVIADYAIEEYLVGEGFTNLVYCENVNDAITKLLNGEIDLFPSDKYTTESTLESMGKSTYSLLSQLTIKTDMIYFAFNKNISDDLISDFQDAFNRTKKNGLLKELTQKYLHSSTYPDIVQIYTEPYPPLTFRSENGEIQGYGTDIVNEIMKRNNICYDIHLSSWSNGYQMALVNPNFCLFTMDKTDIRENLFKWVGPIGTNTTWIYVKEGSGIVVKSIEDAKNLPSIGVVNSWFSTQYLEQLGFNNLLFDSDPEALAEKLIKGEISAFICSDVTFPDILAQAGYTCNLVSKSYSLMSSDFYIAFSTETSTSIVNQWQSTLDAIKQDGTYTAIHQKWFP